MLSLSDIVNVKVGIGRGVFEAPGATVIGGKKPSFNLEILKLFANGEQGFYQDPYDLGVMYQDSAGTTAVNATGQPLGLVLDKSKGLVLGDELVTNGDFSNSLTGWTPAGVTQLVSDGQLEVTVAAVPNAANQIIPTVIGKTYLFTCYAIAHATNTTANSARMRVAGSGIYRAAVTANGTKQKLQIIYTATATTTLIELQVASHSAFGVVGEKAYFDNVSAKELVGNHAYQTTSSMRPLLAASPQRLDYDTIDDKLITTLPAQLTGCTVIRSVPGVGVQLLTNQTIPATYEDNKDHCGLIVINRALTPSETSAIAAEFNKRAGV